MGNLCLNCLYDFFENPEAAARSLFPYLDRANNHAIQVTAGARVEQGFAFAKTLRSRYPKMEVVFRKTPDNNQHEHFPDPNAWFESFAPWSDGGNLILSNTNEPGTGGLKQQNEWMASTLERCGQAGIRCATWSLQTHNHDFDPADLDATIRLCGQYNHPFSLHYYYSEGHPLDPIHKKIAAYCREKRIKVPRFFITELGYDQGLSVFGGYQGRRSSEQVALELVNIGEFYSDLDFFIYCWGAEPPWGDFDISLDTIIQNALVIHNRKQEGVTPVTILPPTSGGVERLLKTVPSGFINVRSQPGFKSDGKPVGVDVGDLLAGDRVILYPPTADYPDWVYQTPLDAVDRPLGRAPAVAGWVSLQGGAVRFEPVGTDVPPPAPPDPNPETVCLTKTEYELIGQQLQTALVAVTDALERWKGVKLPDNTDSRPFPD